MVRLLRDSAHQQRRRELTLHPQHQGSPRQARRVRAHFVMMQIVLLFSSFYKSYGTTGTTQYTAGFMTCRKVPESSITTAFAECLQPDCCNESTGRDDDDTR